ncbi:RuBisCO large subunit C-terminal-like domain-containing protein [Nitrospira sp. Kam-Ns4a]
MAGAASLDLSGRRFLIRYELTGSEADARALADELCYEQTVEVHREVVPPGPIREQLVGRVEGFRRLPSGAFEVALSFAIETVGCELPQLLNVLFGNASLQPGVRLVRIEPPPEGFEWLPGPRFGRAGLRALVGAPDRPLLCSALKPMGLSAKDLATMAYQLTVGGIDLIKDDHGLADQRFSPFEERVGRCAEAVAKANRETGRRSLYAANVTAPSGLTLQRARLAQAAGAGAVVLSPGLAGWDAVRELASEAGPALPVLCHPALLGTFVADPRQGIGHAVLFGQLPRLAGADATIFPTHGGRFAFSAEDCRAIVAGTSEPLGPCRPIFPVAGGGIRLERVGELREFYGRDVVLLIGSWLRLAGPDLIANCRRFYRAVAGADPD